MNRFADFERAWCFPALARPRRACGSTFPYTQTASHSTGTPLDRPRAWKRYTATTHGSASISSIRSVGVVIEGLLRGGSVSLYTLDPVVDGGPWEFALIAPFDVWMEQLSGDAVEVLRAVLAPVEDFGGPPNALHVLLGHRSPSISLAGG
jgi:hypothetical protein